MRQPHARRLHNDTTDLKGRHEMDMSRDSHQDHLRHDLAKPRCYMVSGGQSQQEDGIVHWLSSALRCAVSWCTSLDVLIAPGSPDVPIAQATVDDVVQCRR